MPDGYPVLVVNAGSHSLDLSVVDAGLEIIRHATVDADPGGADAATALADFLTEIPGVKSVGHRLVHGGPDLVTPCQINDDVREYLGSVSDLAPQHLPPALAAVDRCREQLPDTPQVACFDTAFHRYLPEPNHTYAIPARWRRDFGIRRYGFHGLSYAWALTRAAELLRRDPAELQLVMTHLGGGASVCAVRDGVSVSTSMGFTPLEGLVMSHRSGSVDPGMLLWLQTQHGLSASEVTHGLQQESGLLGLSDGLSGDTRDLVNAAQDGNVAAALAMAVFTLRIRQEVAAAAASLDRLDGLVFTGQIGADQPEVRESVVAGLPVLGLAGGLHKEQGQDAILSSSGVPVVLVHPHEEYQIAHEVTHFLTTP